jgi:hypothetical protein
MTTTNRLFYIDNLRTFLTILVITLHAAVTYGSEGGCQQLPRGHLKHVR